MRDFLLCTSLIALLAAQPVCAQETTTIPLGGQTKNLPPEQGVLAEGSQVRIVLLDSVSSATAVKGQHVRFAIAQEETTAIPTGTVVSGVVKSVRKGIPGKHNGSLELQPQTILFKDGTKLGLRRYDDECGVRIAGCWFIAAFMVAGIAIFLPIELTVAGVNSLSHPHNRRTLTPIRTPIEGTDMELKPCKWFTAYTTRKFKLSPLHDPASSSAATQTQAAVDACPAH